MAEIVETIVRQHDLRLVALAVFMCLLAGSAASALLSRAQASTGRQRLTWIVVAAIEFGSGIWSLHFIAMIAYMPGFPIGYEIVDTILSTAFAVAGALCGFLIALSRLKRPLLIAGGTACLTAAIAGMHYTGIASMRLNGTLLLDPGGVLCSILLSAVFCGVAVWLLTGTLTIHRQLATTAALACAVSILHFGGMSAMSMQMQGGSGSVDGVLGTGSLAIAVAALSIAMLILAFALSIMDQHLAARTIQEKERLHQLAGVSFEGLLIHRQGIILDANQKLYELSGYEGGSLTGQPVSLLFHAPSAEGDHQPSAQDDGLLRCRGGGTIAVDLLARPISYDRVAATAVAVRDLTEKRRSDLALLRLRQISELLTDPQPSSGLDLPPLLARSPRRSRRPDHADPSATVGQIRTLSIVALKRAYAEAWETVAQSALQTAATIIEQALSADDAFTPVGDEGFTIWFADDDDATNAERLAAMARQIRVAFLRDFGANIAAQVEARLVHREAIDLDPAQPAATSVPATATIPEGAQQSDERQAAELGALVEEIRETPAVELRLVTDRNGKSTPIVVLDFLPAIRDQLLSLERAMPGSGTDIGLLRLEVAIRELTIRPRSGGVLVWLSWSTLTLPAVRKLLHERLAATKRAVCEQLMLAVADTPPLLDEKKWSQVIAPIRHKVAEVGLVMNASRGYPTVDEMTPVNNWPLSLLIIDTSEATEPRPERYASIMAAAKTRRISVLVQPSASDDASQWRLAGATMIAAALPAPVTQTVAVPA